MSNFWIAFIAASVLGALGFLLAAALDDGNPDDDDFFDGPEGPA